MRLFFHPSRTARFAAAHCTVIAALFAPGLRAQSSYSPGQTANDAALSNGLFGGDPFPSSLYRSGPIPTPRPVFFPPDPPPLDLVVPRTVASYATRHEASDLLAADVGEPFYSVLAARLDRNELSRGKRDSLERYHEEKNLLQHNLHAELTYILAQDPAVRGGLLAALAQKQDAQILALENRAEEIRSALFSRGYAWDAAHKPRLTDTEPGAYAPDDVAHVMLGAAFFQHGLSAEQRTLLREIAIEVMSGADSAAAAIAAQPYVFFSPGPSRLRLPADLAAAVGAKLAVYQSKKSALRKELYDAVYREDATWLGVMRTLRFNSLAEKQAPEFVALEALAEEIRRDLPPLPSPQPARPTVPLSPALVERIDALRQRQFTEEQEINVRFERSRASESALQLATVFNPELRRY